jgi:hypothetical protein
MKTKPAIPSAAEIDFRNIEPALLREAAVWEYARTSPAVRAAAVRWLDSEIQGKTVREHLLAELRKPCPGARSLLFRILDRDERLALGMVDLSMLHLGKHRRLSMLLWDRADFPAPWTNAQRSPAPAEKSGSVDIEPTPHILNRWDHIGELKDVYRNHFSLNIQWRGATQKQIVGEFARWLAKEAKQHPEMKPRGKGGQIQTEPLKWLAAYRLSAAGLTYPQTVAMLDLYCDPGSRVRQNLARLAGLDPADVPLPLKAKVQSPDALPDFKGESTFSKAVGKARKLLARFEKGEFLTSCPLIESE